MQRTIREAIKIGYVEQALRLKKKLHRLIKAMSLLLGSTAVLLAVILELLRQRDRRKAQQNPQETADLQEITEAQISVPQKANTAAE